LAERIRVNPTTLSTVLNERVPLPTAMAEKIRRALEEPRA
jgi:plasmid maintenance system antidote protein VapI